MCGIAGIIRFTDPPVDPAALERTCSTQHHRGPDQSGVWIDQRNAGAVGFAATRLAVLDPSKGCSQPFTDPTGRYVLVYNGELYNYRALRSELSDLGHRFRTLGDTEVLLAACTQWGVDALRRFQGMWAFAFYDAHSRSGFLARDRFGIKPLLYASNAQRLLFASEMAGLQSLECLDDAIEPPALVQLLRYGYIASPRTILKTVWQLSPGHYLPFRASAAEPPIRYYHPVQAVAVKTVAATPPPKHRTYGDSCAAIRRALESAVVARRICDVPIGSFLSGGLDSAIITYHLRQALGGPVDTFSLGYVDHRSYDESRFALAAARHLDTRHHPLMLTQRDVVQSIPTLLDHLSQPVGDSSIIPTALLSQFARQQVTVALSGDGGDELFGGYWRYLGHDAWRAYRRVPLMLRRRVIEPLLTRCAAARTSTLSNRARQFRKLIRAESNDPFTRHLAWSRILAPEAENLFYDADLGLDLDAEMLDLARTLTAGLPDDSPLPRILAFDLQFSLPADMLHKVDTASMMHSLEVRVPFLDPLVVHQALALPLESRIDRGLRKRILIDAYRGRLPDQILDRSKQGFEVPIGELFRGPLREMFFDVVTPSCVENLGFLSYPAVVSAFNRHADRRSDHADLLFALLSLCRWRRKQTLQP